MSYPTYKTFDQKHVTNSAPVKRTPKVGADGKQAPDYHTIPLSYNIGTEEVPLFENFELEGCELSTPSGITSKANQNDPSKMEDSILAKFDTTNEEHAKFLEVIDEIYDKCCTIINGVKFVVKKKDFDVKSPKGVFKHPIYIPMDETTGEVLVGRLPSMFLRIFSRGSGAFKDETLFVDGYNKPIDKKLLYGVEMKFIPLFHFKWIHVGTGINLQVELKSAAVTYVKKRNTESTQFATINSLASIRPNYASDLANQLAKLTCEAQELPNPLVTDPSTKEQKESNSTMDDLEPTDASTIPAKLQEAVNNAPKRFKVPFNKN